MKRVDVINRIGDLTEQECQPCENSGGNHSSEMCASCSVYKELRRLGEQLNGMAGSKRKAAEILAKGEMITWKDVDQLIELDVPKKKIMKAMGMSQSEFFKSQRERGMKVEANDIKQLTTEAYMKSKAEGVSDSKIIKRLGTNAVKFTAWKKENLTPEQIEKSKLIKSPKSPAERLKESENTKVQEVESNAVFEGSDASNEPLVKLKAEYENQSVAGKLKEKYKAEIENEVKEQVRHLAAENKELHEQNRNLEKLNADVTGVLELKNYEIDQLRKSVERMKNEKVQLLAKQNEEISNYQGVIKDKYAEIGALQSNNEDLLGTIERLQKELTHVRRELELATTETDAAVLGIYDKTPVAIEQPIDFRMQEENAALKTLVKLYIS